MKSITALLAACVYCICKFANASEPDWNSYQPGGSACYIKLPVNPEYQTQLNDTMVIHVYIAKDTSFNPPSAYALSFVDYPKEKLAEKDAGKKILDLERDSFVRAVNGKILSEKNALFGLHPARSLNVSAENGQVQYIMRLFLIDARIYHVVACVPAQRANDDTVIKFLTSFQIPKSK